MDLEGFSTGVLWWSSRSSIETMVHLVKTDVAFVIVASRRGWLFNFVESHGEDLIDFELVASTFQISVKVVTVVVARILERCYSSHLIIWRSSMHKLILYKSILTWVLRLSFTNNLCCIQLEVSFNRQWLCDLQDLSPWGKTISNRLTTGYF